MSFGGGGGQKPLHRQCKADAGSGSSAPLGLAFLGHLDNGTKPTSQPFGCGDSSSSDKA